MAEKKSVILVVVSDPNILGKFLKEKEINSIFPITAKGPDEARNLMEDKSLIMKGLCVSAHLPSFKWIQVVQDFHRTRTGAPIFLIRKVAL